MENPILIAAEYKKVIDAFKNRSDVQSGKALGYRQGQDPNGELKFENTPKGIGDGLATTGWCVSASQALLLDNIFQIMIKSRGALAKLISIDIKEQYYGQTYTGHQNMWHTAILVRDSGINLVIDMTCQQFGNRFINKHIWDFETWEATFRSPICSHKLADFDGNMITFLPLQSKLIKTESSKLFIENKLNTITTLNDSERKLISDFFIEKIEIINQKLLLGNINKFDYTYINGINGLLKNLDFVDLTNQYCVMQFDSSVGAKRWIENFSKNDFIFNQYIVASKSIEDSCLYNNIKFESINTETINDTTFIVLEFLSAKGFSMDFIQNASVCIPNGIHTYFDIATDIVNGGTMLNTSQGGIPKKTNTIFIRLSN